MKSLILSTGVAAAMGVIAMGSANAAPISTHGMIAAPAVTSDVACRTVKKTVFRNGVKRVTTSKQCDGMGRPGARVYVAPRRYYARPRPYRRPGVSVGIGIR